MARSTTSQTTSQPTRVATSPSNHSGQQASNQPDNEPQTQEEGHTSDLAASSNQGSKAPAEFCDPENCGSDVNPTCCELCEEIDWLVCNSCFCDDLGGRPVYCNSAMNAAFAVRGTGLFALAVVEGSGGCRIGASAGVSRDF
jgi:hypothetical protein